ncbi:MAG: hypothetical protein M1416_02475 [Candidatus Pacearchaeota archaeon]|nr:hypothetical protein [Candidatus Pacearchaeota archaeon]
MIASICSGVALVPQVITGFKKKKKTINFSTSLITVLVIYTMAFVLFTLGLYLSTIINIISGTLWLTLFIQSIIYKN